MDAPVRVPKFGLAPQVAGHRCLDVASDEVLVAHRFPSSIRAVSLRGALIRGQRSATCACGRPAPVLNPHPGADGHRVRWAGSERTRDTRTAAQMPETNGELPMSDGSTCILVADDDAGTRALIASILGRDGYRLVETEDGVEALAAAYAQRPDLLLTDIQMPLMNGVELTRRLRADLSMATLPIILVSGLHESADKVAGLDAGATDFVTKPFDRAELRARVRAALRTRAAFRRLESVQSILAALANAVEAKDPNTQHHCGRMASLALTLGRCAGLPMDVLEAIGYGAVLHDVGKIGVPERVLLKPGPLDEEDWVHMRQHPGIGATIVEPLQLGKLVAPIVRSHHERWDGGGYPDRLRGGAIPLGARIVAVVDAYDAITQERPYRRALSADEAREEIIAGAGTQFDPELAQTFIDSLDGSPTPAHPDEDAFVRGLTIEAA